MANVIRAGLMCGWWALMMTTDSGEMNSSLKNAYNIVLKVCWLGMILPLLAGWGCWRGSGRG